jgi:hypothetical protein
VDTHVGLHLSRGLLQILRQNNERLGGYTRWFSIYDDDDSLKVVRLSA